MATTTIANRTYPHVEGIPDVNTKQSVRRLWDRLFTIETALGTANTLATTQATTLTDLQTRLATAEKALTKVQLQVAQTAADVAAGGGSGGGTVIDGPFAVGPTAINFAGLGIVQVYSSPDVSGWTETGVINRLGFDPGLLTVNYSTMAAWLPGVNIGGAMQEATLWLFFQILGTWYGAGAERFRPNQTTKVKATNYSQWPGDLWFDASRWGPLAGMVPFAGQPAAALMTAGSTRSDNRTLVTERTALLTFSWPPDGPSVSFP